MCDQCSLFTNNKKDYGKHLLTAKHLKGVVSISATQDDSNYECICGKIYNHRASLYKHKKCCLNELTVNGSNNKLITNANIKELQAQVHTLFSRNNELSKRITILEQQAVPNENHLK